ncbi:MAG: hypothetical protein KHX03_06505 [Clostridium sp.]|nr:hypothetical protein [Clostridium sp.]
MKKVIDITEILEQEKAEVRPQTAPEPKLEKATNPIFKKLAQFQHSKLSKKFDINDLI